MPVGALIGATVVGVGGSALSSHAQSKAAGKASDAQVQAAQLGVDEERAAREEMRKLLAPYVAAGGPALQAQLDLLGLGSPEGQAGAIRAAETDPIYRALLGQGEEAILQNASATGGLRGGNTQDALARFRPQLLQQFINDRFTKLGGITTLGQNSAAGVGAAGMSSADAISRLFGDVGAAQAGGYLAKGNAQANMFGNIGNLFGQAAGFGIGQGLF